MLHGNVNDISSYMKTEGAEEEEREARKQGFVVSFYVSLFFFPFSRWGVVPSHSL